MNPIVSEWLNLIIRWAHVITGIAWIGASFYFNWLLNRLRDPEPTDKKVMGELWAIHAGGFFKVQKRHLEPGTLPDPLHWFKWEAYWTWITGFMLLVLIYYFGASAYLIDSNVAEISPGAAIAIGLGTLVFGWFGYDLFWSLQAIKDRPRFGALVSFLLVVAIAYGLGQVFSGRGAYLHVGAMLGTIMAANVFAVIMPAQRQLVAATLQGAEQDMQLAANAGLRSLHNNYMTLPVLFVMLSIHYPGTYGYEHGWAVLAAMFLIGALVRHYFNVRHIQGNWRPAWMLGVAALMVVALAVITAPKQAPGDMRVSTAQAMSIVQEHCTTCHSVSPDRPEFQSAIKGLMFDTPEQVRKDAARVIAQAVHSNAMPLGNQTGMTAEERTLLGAWLTQPVNEE